MRILLLLLSFLVFSVSAQAQVNQSTSASHAILVDAETGTVLLEKKANDRMPTSSMSKVMTVFMVFEALKEGRLNLSDTMPVSEKAWRKGGSKMFVELGSKVKIEDLLRGVIIQSGNDATIVLSEGLMGSEDVFSEAMTQRAQDLGMTNSRFKNASGWPDPDHYSTPRDLALLAYKTMTNFPEYYGYFSEKEFTYNKIKQPNRNPLLFRKMGVDGLKTGHTDAGGYGLMATASRGDRRLILVVNGLKSSRERAQESARLIEWGFGAFENTTLFKEGDKVDTAEVTLGQSLTVPLVIANNVRVAIPKKQKNKMKVTVRYEGPFMAPVAKGTEVGEIVIEIPGQPTQKHKILTGADVAELGLLTKTMAKAKFFLLGRY